MTRPADISLLEQLSAYVDGELPEAEARFLQRRLEHDAELRGHWTRMQLAGTCLRGQAWQPMDAGLCARVGADIAQDRPGARARPALRWAMAASVAGLAILFAPRLLHNASPGTLATTVSPAAPALVHDVASPSLADLVAVRAPADRAAAVKDVTAAAGQAAGGELIASHAPASGRETSVPLASQSPSDFPLLASGDKRSWPKPELPADSDPALEAYLVRHNQMLADDGLGGFVPYVDVVANDRSNGAPPASDADAGADRQ